MARWRLTESHYLNSPGTKWRYSEIDSNGEAVEHNFVVPRLMDIKDPRHHTDKDAGVIVVCYEGKGQPSDRVFVGDPTPSMEPLDEEAREISARYEGKWKHAIDSLPAQGFGNELLGALQAQLAAVAATQSPSSMAPNTAIKAEEFSALKTQVDELVKQNQQLMAQLAAKAEAPKAAAGRR